MNRFLSVYANEFFKKREIVCQFFDEFDSNLNHYIDDDFINDVCFSLKPSEDELESSLEAHLLKIQTCLDKVLDHIYDDLEVFEEEFGECEDFKDALTDHFYEFRVLLCRYVEKSYLMFFEK